MSIKFWIYQCASAGCKILGGSVGGPGVGIFLAKSDVRDGNSIIKEPFSRFADNNQITPTPATTMENSRPEPSFDHSTLG